MTTRTEELTPEGPGGISANGETIFALASGHGPAGVAVIRISGPNARIALERVIGREAPEPRRARVATIRDGEGRGIDVGIVLWFPAPRSATGEDVAELHTHGGKAVIAAVLDGLGAIPGLRIAAPGEFTRRAFENGKIDLTAAEGIADLVHAETEAQRRQAFRQMEGALGALYEKWRGEVLRALAYLEVSIDFVDEDLPGDLVSGIGAEVDTVAKEIAAHLGDGGRGERLREGIEVAIVGAPNAGKSTLLNRLVGYDAAIVNAKPGTTRDVIEARMDIGGYPVVIADTAGLRESAEEIEQEGVRRARRRAEGSDIKVAVFDGADWPRVDEETLALVDEGTVLCINKSDLGRVEPSPRIRDRPALTISARDGDGVAELVATIGRVLETTFPVAGAPSLTRARHRQALERCREALERCRDVDDTELAAADLRMAARALGTITGMINVEEILDVVFRDFCIGK